jgi:AAA domain
LLKQGVQDPRGAKSDDLSDVAAWRLATAEICYKHRSVLRPDQKQKAASREDRLEAAYQAALPVFDKELQRRAAVEGADARLAAAKGLIASGVESPADVNAVTKAMRERGVTQRGERTSLVWGEVKGENGRDKVGITTILHRDEELRLVANARAAAKDRTAALTPEQIAAAVKRFPDLDFTSEHGKAQRAVMEQLGTGGRLSVAIGVAGSGKSTLLKPLVDAWKADGRQVHGIALAWRQFFAVRGGSRQVNAFGAYTSGSRHREQSFIVTSDGAERQEVAGRRPLGDNRQVRERDVIENVARNFARQPVKEGSLAMIARAENLRTGTIQMMQAGKQRLEQRAVEGKSKSTLAATFQSKRDDAKARTPQPASENAAAKRRDLLQRIKDIGPQVREAMRAAVERVRALRDREAEKATAGRRRGRRM